MLQGGKPPQESQSGCPSSYLMMASLCWSRSQSAPDGYYGPDADKEKKTIRKHKAIKALSSLQGILVLRCEKFKLPDRFINQVE